MDIEPPVSDFGVFNGVYRIDQAFKQGNEWLGKRKLQIIDSANDIDLHLSFLVFAAAVCEYESLLGKTRICPDQPCGRDSALPGP